MVDLGVEQRVSAFCMHWKVSAGLVGISHGNVRCECTVYDESGCNFLLIRIS